MKYKRLLLKISGEALQNREMGLNHDPNILESIAIQFRSLLDSGAELAVVVGGGNIFRGIEGVSIGTDRTTGDYMGMLATVINAMAIQSALEKNNIQTRVMTAISMPSIAEPFIRRRAIRHIEKGRVVIFGAGTGNPYFTTDTAATLRATEMKCEAIFKGTQVDGVYDSDPKINSNAKFYKTISYDTILQRKLKVMDASAIALARDNKLPIIIFSLSAPNGLLGIIEGKGHFTRVEN